MAADTKRGRRFCYSCGTVHRPGENTLCPVTQTITSNSAYSGVSPALHTSQCYTLDEAVAQLAAQGLVVVTKAEAEELAALRERVERALREEDAKAKAGQYGNDMGEAYTALQDVVKEALRGR